MYFDHRQFHAFNKYSIILSLLYKIPQNYYLDKKKDLSHDLSTQRDNHFYGDDYNHTQHGVKKKKDIPQLQCYFFLSLSFLFSNHFCIPSSLDPLSHPSHSLFCFTYPFTLPTPALPPQFRLHENGDKDSYIQFIGQSETEPALNCAILCSALESAALHFQSIQHPSSFRHSNRKARGG